MGEGRAHLFLFTLASYKSQQVPSQVDRSNIAVYCNMDMRTRSRGERCDPYPCLKIDRYIARCW